MVHRGEEYTEQGGLWSTEAKSILNKEDYGPQRKRVYLTRKIMVNCGEEYT